MPPNLERRLAAAYRAWFTFCVGTGRFAKAGIPAAEFFSIADGVVEITCGTLILLGLLTRVATLPMIVDMIGALLITKLAIFSGNARLFRGEHGWWDFIHESRVDLAQLCGSLFLLVVGAGTCSLDARLTRSASRPQWRRRDSPGS